ncbi:DUF2935 domain-containing protein [Paenibacillus aurantius]|uniref:DUF2935 domain-containing protein n=1 Tax=Paenibacillus aurantius TaxID=2918900 RepID=A0AA96RBU6_9BACL|nr:DUF2935 domain-containing protein [Paenibacillus aurantius]WNQ09790.1 DUF2935 domain-containing protein [Paenibacillus aurantius]
MTEKGYVESALTEHRFWLQVLGDHGRFIRDSLPPKEALEIRRAHEFVQTFDALLAQARTLPPDRANVMALSRQASEKASELRGFKLHLLQRQLTGGLASHLPPTFYNHMVNEVEEYLKILVPLTAGEPAPPASALHLHLLWLDDAYGHSATISSKLDLTEKRVKELSDSFTKHFEEFYLKAFELAGYMRTHLAHFPALSRFNKQVELEMLLFREFLKELEEMGLRAELLGTLTPLMADHMAREECYYLTKLALVAETKNPSCDPAKPRIEA